MKPTAATLFHLQQRRLEVLKKAATARKAHRGQRLASRDAKKATHSLLKAELKARQIEAKSAAKAAPSNDLFSLELV
jgi:hypothetical protein